MTEQLKRVTICKSFCKQCSDARGPLIYCLYMGCITIYDVYKCPINENKYKAVNSDINTNE
jgi:hypothetical protein